MPIPDALGDRKSNAPVTVYTVGHSTHELPEFVGLLREHGVDALVDVRRYPGSRHTPGFCQAPLRAALLDAGIEYRHSVDLGGRRSRQPPPSRNDWWTHPSFRNYADYAERDPAFRAALTELLEICRTRTAAIMCAEALWWKCHRRIIADYLAANGIGVYHIAANGRVERAVLNPAACRCGQALVYERRS